MNVQEACDYRGTPRRTHKGQMRSGLGTILHTHNTAHTHNVSRGVACRHALRKPEEPLHAGGCPAFRCIVVHIHHCFIFFSLEGLWSNLQRKLLRERAGS